MRTAVEQFGIAIRDPKVKFAIFYYAGHGVINNKNEFYLVPYDVTQLYGNDDALAGPATLEQKRRQTSELLTAFDRLGVADIR